MTGKNSAKTTVFTSGLLLRGFALAACLLGLGGSLSVEAQDRDPQSTRASTDEQQLKQWLERFPAADGNRDGVLTIEEARAYREQIEARRKTTLPAGDRPRPKFADVRYGPHQRNLFDLWLPEGASDEKPLPVFVYFHGGGFVAGDKSKFDPRPYLRQGLAVVSSNYRFVDGKDVLTPVPMQDAARAIQYLRHQAARFGIDPKKVAVSGGSAGAVITMWIAYKDEMADPDSNDPVCRQSTRVSCIVPLAGPTVLDPEWINKNMGGPPEVHSSLPKFYGVRDADYGGADVRQMIAEASPISHASADDPPTFLIYGGALDNLPLAEDASQGLLIHHPFFGKVLKDKLDPLGVPCEFRYGGAPPGPNEVAEFLAKYLKD